MQQHNSFPPTASIDKKDRYAMKKPALLHRFLKRLLDLLLSFTGIVLISPIFILVLLLQWCTTPGTAFFRQERIGKDGKPFHIIKFRTMQLDAESDGPQLVNIQNSSRFTRCGQFLRKHHLDELPQLWNVLIGDMSFVGYRPERAFFINQIMEKDQRYAMLFAIRPGITSEAAIYNGYTDTMEKMLRRLEMDIDYMKRVSLKTDIIIIFKSIYMLMSGKQYANTKV